MGAFFDTVPHLLPIQKYHLTIDTKKVKLVSPQETPV